MYLEPALKPDVEDAPWRDAEWYENAWDAYVAIVAWMSEPWFFYATQLFTWGESDLQDFQILFMDNEEAATYFLIQWAILPFQTIYSIVWMEWAWWTYAGLIAWGVGKWWFKNRSMMFMYWSGSGYTY